MVLEWLTASFTTITGYPVDDVRKSPNPLAVYIHPEDLPRIVEMIRTLPPMQPTTYEFRIRTKDGRERWIQSTARAIQDPSGQLRRLYGAARDITEQKQRDEEILESRRLRDRMAETIPDIVYTYDLEQNAFVYVNRQHLHHSGLSPRAGDVSDGCPVSESCPWRRPRTGAGTGCTHHASRRWRGDYHGTAAQTCPRGVAFAALSRERGAAERTGAPRQIVGTAQDITERKWLEDLLRERVLDRTELPARLKEFRTGLRLSQAQFGAQFGGYNQPQISSYEGGDSAIPLGLLLAIRDKGYPVEAVLGGGSRDVVSQTATYLPAQHHKKLLALIAPRRPCGW